MLSQFRQAFHARYNNYWVAMWAVNTLILVGMLLATVTPTTWLSTALVLFLIPESIGLIRKGDSLPPLTFVIRRYVPQWIVLPVIWTLGAWAVFGWWPSPHHEAITLVVVFVTGWLTNHFIVTYNSPGE